MPLFAVLCIVVVESADASVLLRHSYPMRAFWRWMNIPQVRRPKKNLASFPALCACVRTGLDSSVTFKITSGIRSWAQSNQGTVVATLQQATPEVFDLFDDVILLREGRIIYHGPRDALPRYLAGQGFSLPANPRAPQQQNADNEPLIRSNPKRRLSCTPTTTSTTRSTALASSNWKSALFSSARTLFAPTTQSDATSEVRVEGDAGIAGASDIADWLISVITNPDRARINGAAVTAEPSPTLSHNVG